MVQPNIAWSQLKDELRKVRYEMKVCQCHYEKYLDWVRVDREDAAQMKEIGDLVDNNGQDQLSPNVHPLHEYWGKNAKMALGYYPYGGCRVHECIHCRRLFFVYREMAGHAAELRCRYIKEELLVFESPV